MATLLKRLKAAISIGNNDSWSNPDAVTPKTVQRSQNTQNLIATGGQRLQTTSFGSVPAPVRPTFNVSAASVAKPILTTPQQIATAPQSNKTFAQNVAPTTNAIKTVAKTVAKPFWETGDLAKSAVQLGVANATGNTVAANNVRTNRDQSYQQSLAPMVSRSYNRLKQTPVVGDLIAPGQRQMQATLENKLSQIQTQNNKTSTNLIKNVQAGVKSGQYDPTKAAEYIRQTGAVLNAPNQTLNAMQMKKLQDANFGLNDSKTRMFAQTAGDLANVAGFAVSPVSGASLAGMPVKQALRTGATDLATNATLNGAGGGLSAYGQGANAADALKAGLLSAGMTIPLMGAGYAGGAIKQIAKTAQPLDQSGKIQNPFVALANKTQGNSTQYYPGTALQFDNANGKLSFHPQQARDAISLNVADAKAKLADQMRMKVTPLNQVGGASSDAFYGEGKTNKTLDVPKTETSGVKPPVEPPAIHTAAQPPIVPPNSRIAVAGGELVPNSENGLSVPNGTQTKTRYAAKTVPENPYISEGVKEKLDAPTYDKNTEAQAVTESGRRYQQVGEDQYLHNTEQALDKPKGTITRQEAVDAQSAASLLDMRPDEISQARAARIYEKLSEHFTAAGQTVQAAAMMARRSADGLLYHAEKTLREAGVTMPPQLRAELKTDIEAIRGMKNGTAREYAVNRVLKKVTDQVPSDLADKITSTWKAGLLTGVKTQTGNFLSNGTFGVLHDASNPLASAIDKGISIFTGKRTKTLTGQGRLSGAVEGVGHAKRFMQTGIDERVALIGKYEGGGVVFKNKALNTYVNGVFKLMGAADRPAYYSQLKNSLYDLAEAEAKNKGLSGAERTAFIKDAIDNPHEAMLQVAVNEANKAVLNYDTILSKGAAAIANALNKMPANTKIGKFAAKLALGFNAPFVRVPSAFLSRTIDFTALGVPKEIFHQISQGKFDQRALSTALSEATTGTAVLALGVALANARLLTGSYPTDPKEQERWKTDKIQPNSVKFGGTYLSLNYMGPVGMIFGMSNRISDARAKGSNTIGQVGQAVAGLPKDLTQQSFLQGLNKAISAVNDPGRYATNYVNSLASSTIPTLMGDVAVGADKAQRAVVSAKDAIQAKIPGLRNMLPQDQDVYGNPLERKTGAINSLINPLRPSDGVTSPVLSEVDRLHNVDPNNKDLQVTPTPIDKVVSFGSKKVTLTDNQRRELQTMTGAFTQQKWDELIKNPEYQKLSDEDKASALTKLKQDAATVQKKQFSIANKIQMNNLTKSQLRLASGSSSVDNYTKTAAQKAALGSPAEKYQTALDNYNKNQGTMSDITKYSTNKSLAKLKVNAPYSNDVVSLYGMSKTEALKYLSTETKGVDKKSLYDQLLAYDKALVAAGINKTLKFSGSTSTKKSGSGSKTSTLAAATAAITANNAARSATKKFKMSAAPTATATLKKQAQTPLKKYATAKHSVDLRKLANLV